MDQTAQPSAGDIGTPASAPPQAPSGTQRSLASMIELSLFVIAELLVVAVLVVLGYRTYHDYKVRADVQDLLTHAQALQPAVDAATARNAGRCLRDETLTRQLREVRYDPTRASLAAGEFAGGRCGILLVLHGDDSLEGKQILWERVATVDSVQWRCDSDLANRFLPPVCQSQ